MNEKVTLIDQELERYPSRRRKKIMRLATPDLIREIESEILRINGYLVGRVINERGSYRPNTGDEDQPLRERAEYLLNFVNKLKNL